MIFKKIYTELKLFRESYETVHADKLKQLQQQRRLPIAQIALAQSEAEEGMLDVDFTKEVAEEIEERERKLWEGKAEG